MSTEFNKWWNEDDLTTEGNNFVDGTPAYWAWEGWCAGVKAERAACAKVCDAAYDEFFVRHELEYPKARYDQASVTRTVKAAVEFVTEDVAAAIRARGTHEA